MARLGPKMWRPNPAHRRYPPQPLRFQRLGTSFILLPHHGRRGYPGDLALLCHSRVADNGSNAQAIVLAWIPEGGKFASACPPVAGL